MFLNILHNHLAGLLYKAKTLMPIAEAHTIILIVNTYFFLPFPPIIKRNHFDLLNFLTTRLPTTYPT